MNNISDFWTWFVGQATYLNEELDQHPDEIAEVVSDHLKEVHPDLVFDIPFEYADEKRELIISADGDASLFPLVQELVARAPDLPQWHIIGLRPRTDQLDQAIDLDGLYLEYEDIFFTVENDSLPMQLNIYIRGYDNHDNRYIHGYFLLLDTLLGEYDAVTYTETIGVFPLDEEDGLRRFLELRDIFDQWNKNKN